MNDVEKKAKYCKQYAMIYFVFSVIAIVYYLTKGIFLGANVIAAILLLACFIGSNNQEKYGPICGIIACIMMIVTKNVVEIILAIFLLINCIGLLREL